MLNSLSIHNIENFKLDIIFYISIVVYETWWTSKHYKQKYFEIADIYNLSVLALADFINFNYLKLGSIDYNSIHYYIIDCSNKKLLTEEEKKWIAFSILYYNKYRDIESDNNLISSVIEKMRLDNGLLRN